MGGLVQQINLYRGHDAKSTANANVRLLLISGVGAICLVLVLAIAGKIYMSGVAADRALVAESLRNREAELAKFSATFTVPAIDPHLEAELTRLRAVRDGMNTNLVLIARQTGTRSEGFSAYFGGLARNTLDGLWFNNVAVSAGGEEMLLKGRTVGPELVPRLLQTLAGEQAFAGRSFRKVTFERQESESGALIDFELRSAQSEEIDDAG
jgi:hypothetical protein